MLRSTVNILVLGVLMAPALADSPGDPTFSGIAPRVNCEVRNIMQCRGTTCIQPVQSCQGGLCGTLDLLLKTSQFSFDNTLAKPFQITGTSPAELNKPLWDDFQITLEGQSGTGRLTLLPNAPGGYAASTVIVMALTDDQKRAVSAYTGLQCTIVPD